MSIGDPTVSTVVPDLRVGDVIVKDVNLGPRVYIESAITEVLTRNYAHPHVEGWTWTIVRVDSKGNFIVPTKGTTMMLPNHDLVRILRRTVTA